MSMRIERITTKHRRQIWLSLAGSMMVAGALALTSPAAVAQGPATKASASEDLRPAFANPEEVADGKRLADTSCIGCHGNTGISSTPGVPNLAGQRPAYLYTELKAYRAGNRGELRKDHRRRHEPDEDVEHLERIPGPFPSAVGEFQAKREYLGTPADHPEHRLQVGEFARPPVLRLLGHRDRVVLRVGQVRLAVGVAEVMRRERVTPLV